MDLTLLCFWLAFFTFQEVTMVTSYHSNQTLITAESRLLKKLLSAVEERGLLSRPVRNSSLPVTVNFGMRLINMNLDETDQTMKASAWLRITWWDPIFKWNPQDYGGQRYVVLPSHKIWVPRIYNVNSISEKKMPKVIDVRISYLGVMFWTPQQRYSVGCAIDTTQYPFDEHTCSMWFQSIGETTALLELRPYTGVPFDLSTSQLEEYRKSRAWTISANKTELVLQPKDEEAILVYSSRPSLKFSLTVKRRTTFQAYLLLIPCVILPGIGTCAFTLPPHRPDRIALLMGLFSAYVILLLLLTQTIPPSPAAVPKLCLYYAVNLALIPLSIMLTCVVINLNQRNDNEHPMPSWMRKVILRRLGIFCGLREKLRKNQPRLFSGSPDRRQAGDSLMDVNVEFDPLKAHSQLMNRVIQVQEDKTPALLGQWQLCALVFDRFLFWLSLVVNLVCFFVFFPI